MASMNPPQERILPPILITDDDTDDLFFLKRSIAKTGVQNPVISFADGDILIKFLRGLSEQVEHGNFLRPCVLFLDIKMPGANGFEVLEWIRTHPAIVAGIKIVMHSGSNEAIDVERAESLGAHHFIQKQASVEVLQQVWEQFISPSSTPGAAGAATPGG